MKNEKSRMKVSKMAPETKDLPLSPGSYCSEANRMLSELVIVSWLARQKKERRRLVIASLESLLSEWSTAETTLLLRGRDLGNKQDQADRRDRNR
jgi:hypothetical protein